MDYFLDTSAFIKVVRDEAGSEWIRGVLRDPNNQFYLSRLVLPESFSVLGRLWRSGALTLAERDEIASTLRQLIRSKRVHVRPMGNSIVNEAGELALTTVAAQYPLFALRALDALQLATALDIRRRVPELVFVSADQRLLALAQTTGLPVHDSAVGQSSTG